MYNSFYLELQDIVAKMADYCATTKGKEMLLDSKPSFDKLVIKRDNKRIKEALTITYKYSSMPIVGIRDISMAVNNASKGIVLLGQDFLNVIDFINGTNTILSFMKDLTEFESIRELTNSLVCLDKLKKILSETFNAYGDVVDGASAELAMVRKKIKQLDDHIIEQANRFIQTHGDICVDGIISKRNNRVCILIKTSNKNSYGGFVHGQSASGMASYVEPSALIELNNQKLVLQEKEAKEVERILRNCSNLVANEAYSLLGNFETITLLDVIFAKASWGKANDACVLDLSEDASINLTKAYHPLIDVKKVVKNNYRLCAPQKMLLVTGPNTGGKSVTLKVIALSVLMTYCGMPMTCEKGSIGFFDNVFMDIGDMQSIESSLSTFSAHLSNLAHICDYATDKSLVLLDEIGSGTDPREGESLAIAIFNYLRKVGCLCVATTHFNRLKNYGKRHDDILVSSVLFDEETLMPTYRYIENLTGQSNALTIARSYGLKKEIIKEATFLNQQNKSQEEILIEKLEKQITENEFLKQQLDEKLEVIKNKEEELKVKQNKIDSILNNYMDKAKLEAQAYLDKVKSEADEILATLINNPNVKYHEALQVSKAFENVVEEDEANEMIDEEIKVGDFVEIKQTNQIATVVDINKDNVLLDLNGIKVKSKLKKLRKSERRVKLRMPKKERNNFVVKTMPLECNLIGMRVDEALQVLDKYLDDAKVYGLSCVRIIHGDGTGALRKAVHHRLSKDKAIKEYRLGTLSEGSTGATVVTFW